MPTVYSSNAGPFHETAAGMNRVYKINVAPQNVRSIFRIMRSIFPW